MRLRLFKRPCLAETLVCLLGLVASIVPALVYTYPFWGVSAFIDKEPFSDEAPGVIVGQIDDESPVASAGILPHDRVIQFNNKPLQFANFRKTLAAVEPGELISIDVKREGKAVRLEYKGEAPRLEGVLFFDWQFWLRRPLFSFCSSLLVATAQPLQPAPLWRDDHLLPSPGLGILSCHNRDRSNAAESLVVGLAIEINRPHSFPRPAPDPRSSSVAVRPGTQLLGSVRNSWLPAWRS